MASTTASNSSNRQERWSQLARTWLGRITIAAVFFLAGLYIAAPQMQQRQATYLPQAFANLPLGAVAVMQEDGTGALLPVRVANTQAHRTQSFRGVGEEAMENQFILYSLTRATTSRATYSTVDFGAPVEFAVVGPTGEIVEVHRATPGSTRVAVPESHQWVIVGKAGSLERLGIIPGASIDPESIQTF